MDMGQNHNLVGCCSEYVGKSIGDTIGIVIPNIDNNLLNSMNISTSYKSLGIVSARIGAITHMLSADEAAKIANVEIVRIELCRDTKGGAGHGVSVIFASEDVSDVRHAVEFMLDDIHRTFKDVYISEYGHIEAHFTPSAEHGVLRLFPDVEFGSAFGAIVGAPAAIGLLMADTALKAGDVKIASYLSASMGTALTNEIVVGIYGETSGVKHAIEEAKKIGLYVLEQFGASVVQATTKFIEKI